MYLPSDDVDVYGATSALIRLQDNYDMTAREIADGNIEGEYLESLNQFDFIVFIQKSVMVHSKQVTHYVNNVRVP